MSVLSSILKGDERMTNKPQRDVSARNPAPRPAWQRPAVDRYLAGSAESGGGFTNEGGFS